MVPARRAAVIAPGAFLPECFHADTQVSSRALHAAAHRLRPVGILYPEVLAFGPVAILVDQVPDELVEALVPRAGDDPDPSCRHRVPPANSLDIKIRWRAWLRVLLERAARSSLMACSTIRSTSPHLMRRRRRRAGRGTGRTGTGSPRSAARC